MAAIAFDTLNFARRLKEAGVPEAQAEAQAELMAEAFVFNMDTLVTEDYLDQCLDGRFEQQNRELDKNFAGIDQRFTAVEGELKLVRWMLALIIITNVIPVLQRWLVQFVL